MTDMKRWNLDKPVLLLTGEELLPIACFPRDSSSKRALFEDEMGILGGSSSKNAKNEDEFLEKRNNKMTHTI